MEFKINNIPILLRGNYTNHTCITTNQTKELFEVKQQIKLELSANTTSLNLYAHGFYVDFDVVTYFKEISANLYLTSTTA